MQQKGRETLQNHTHDISSDTCLKYMPSTTNIAIHASQNLKRQMLRCDLLHWCMKSEAVRIWKGFIAYEHRNSNHVHLKEFGGQTRRTLNPYWCE